MAGYSRQSVADIIANAVIKAAPVNAEFNAIRDAFALSGGHKHDGSSTEGAYVPLIADIDANNKVVVDTANNRVSFYSEVSGSPVEQLRIQDGAIVPVTDNDIDLGTSTLEFKDLYIDGVGYVDTVIIHENATVEGNLTVNGNTTLGTADTDTVTITADVASAILPSLDDTYDLGATGSEWRNLFIDGTANIDSLVADTADINAGTIDNTIIGNTTPAAANFTTIGGTSITTTGNATVGGNLTVTGTSGFTGAITAGALTTTGTSTHATVDINGGAIDGTVIGAASAAAGSFTTLSTSGQATLATVNIDGGTIDNTTIGATTPVSGAFTTITSSGGITGNLTGNVTGNTAGTHTGAVVGNVTGNLTGNVTAATGASTFNNVTINGTLDVTGTVIANVTDPVNAQDAATKNYVDTGLANLIDSAPGTLDTLNELAAALGDDPNFATTITDSIATKLPLAGGTMTGAIAMSTNKITGLGDPTANQDAATKVYVDTADALKLNLSGGTMTGAISMGSNAITNVSDPTNLQDAATKNYIDTLFGSTTAAAASAAAAAVSEANAATSETNAANSASAAAASFDSFDDRYLGAKASSPATDNDGDPLVTGALYFDTTANLMKVYDGSSWVDAGSAVNGTAERNVYTATGGQTTFNVTYDVGYVDVYLNGVKLVVGVDFTATSGTNIVLATGATAGDIVDIIAYGAFNIANTYTQAQADARYLQLLNNLSDLSDAATARNNLGVAIGTDVQAYDAGLADIAALPVTDGNFIVGNGTNWVVESGATARASLGVITSLIEDVSPQLGGDLNLNSNNITGTGNINTTGTLTISGTASVPTVDFGNWTITESGGSLYFATGGVNKMKLDASGNLDVVGNVNSNATIT